MFLKGDNLAEARKLYDEATDDQVKLSIIMSAFLIEAETAQDDARFHEAMEFTAQFAGGTPRPSFDIFVKMALEAGQAYIRHSQYCRRAVLMTDAQFQEYLKSGRASSFGEVVSHEDGSFTFAGIRLVPEKKGGDHGRH